MLKIGRWRVRPLESRRFGAAVKNRTGRLENENGFQYGYRGMYVCVCKAVTITQVDNVIDGGATTREEVTRACGAGGDCGACHGMIEEMLEDRIICPEALVRHRAA